MATSITCLSSPHSAAFASRSQLKLSPFISKWLNGLKTGWADRPARFQLEALIGATRSERFKSSEALLKGIRALIAVAGLGCGLLVFGPPCRAQGNPPIPEPNGTFTSYSATADQIEGLAASTWFALASGVSSIIGLLVALYPTEVRPLPHSMYRTLSWRRLLILSTGSGIAVLSIVKAYNLEPLRLLYEIYGGSEIALLPGAAVGAWLLSAFAGVKLVIIGYRFDPLRAVQQKLREERRALQRARQAEIARLICASPFEEMSESQKILYADLMQYYAAMQVRIMDVLLGPSLPGPSDSYRKSLFDLSLQGASLMQEATIGVRAQRRADEADYPLPETKASFLSSLVNALLSDREEVVNSTGSIQEGTTFEAAQGSTFNTENNIVRDQENKGKEDSAALLTKQILIEAVERFGGVPRVRRRRAAFWKDVAEAVSSLTGASLSADEARRRWQRLKKGEPMSLPPEMVNGSKP